jgi:hypothetical protein
VAIGLQPIGLIFLPIMTLLWASDRQRARWYAAQLSASAVHLALFVTPQTLLFADVAARAWLGSSFAQAGPIIRLTVFPVAFYMCSIILRSPLYGVAVSVVTGAVLLTFEVVNHIDAVAISFSAGLLSVGVLTFLRARAIYEIPSSAWASGTALLLAAVSAGLGSVMRFFVIGSHASLAGLAFVGVLELALAVGFLFGLARSGVSWPGEFGARLLGRGATAS